MKSHISVEAKEDGVIISLAIKLSPNEAGKVLVGMCDDESITPNDFLSMHKEYGIGVVLAYLRTYLFYCSTDGFLVKVKKKMRRKKKS